jgi:4-alpha-glucanotransferase
MRILQFAFHSGAELYLPYSYPTNTVVYTGTHDNDTTVGWWATCSDPERHKLRRYLGYEPVDIAWTAIRLALSSVADTAVFPMQDALRLGSEARMNTPGRAGGNWAWRLRPDVDYDGLAAELRDLVGIYQRGGEA